MNEKREGKGGQIRRRREEIKGREKRKREGKGGQIRRGREEIKGREGKRGKGKGKEEKGREKKKITNKLR